MLICTGFIHTWLILDPRGFGLDKFESSETFEMNNIVRRGNMSDFFYEIMISSLMIGN